MNAKPNDGGPAFPAYTIIESKDAIGRDRTAIVNNGGMSLRACAAIAVLPAIITKITDADISNYKPDVAARRCAFAAIRFADALIAELSEETP